MTGTVTGTDFDAEAVVDALMPKVARAVEAGADAVENLRRCVMAHGPDCADKACEASWSWSLPASAPGA